MAEETSIDKGTAPVGFIGTADGSLEMLFIHADYRVRGIGGRHVDEVISAQHVDRVDERTHELGRLAGGFEADVEVAFLDPRDLGAVLLLDLALEVRREMIVVDDLDK